MGYISEVVIDNAPHRVEPILYGSCSTAAATAEKAISLSNFVLTTGIEVTVKFVNTNTANSPTLKVGNSDAKAIYYRGSAINKDKLVANRIYTFVYDGSHWELIGDLDTNSNTTYTFADGTNGFTVTPLGGTAQTVKVTPSITNNITGSGTSGSIAKFNGVNTIADGPAFGTDTTKFLNNKGEWAVPNYTTNTDEKVAQSANTENKEFSILLKNTNDFNNETKGVKFANTANKKVTVNPSTGRITAPGGLAGKADSAGNADTVNNLTVETAVPANAIFTDTNKYHKTGSWGGTNNLTYTATAVNSADALAFTLATASTSIYGVTKLSAAADNSGLAATAKSVYDLNVKVDGLLAAADAMVFKGTLGTDGTITALPPAHNAGDTYRVITAGNWAGKYCEEGTLIICIKDGTVASNDDWTSVETNEDGAVIGPSTATDNGIVLFSGNTGRIIKNSSKTLTATAPSADSNDTTIPTSKAVWTTVNTAITGLDFTAIGGDTGEYISKISQTDGKISATKATTSVSNTWAAGTTAGPTIKTTVNGIAGTAVAIPSASNTASGVITTGEQTFAGIKTFANTTDSTSTDTGAVLVGGGLGVTGQVTAIRLAANGSNASYNLYVNGTSLLNGNTTVNGNLIPGANNTKTLGSTDAKWAKLYIGDTTSYGDAYTPIYWNNGVPVAMTIVQKVPWSLENTHKSCKIEHSMFTSNSIITQIVVTSGESNLNAPLTWKSNTGYIVINTAVDVSGAVEGYALVIRGEEYAESIFTYTRATTEV